MLFISIINLFGFCLANTHVNASSTAEQKLSLEKNIHNQYLEEALATSTVYNSNITEYHSYLTAYYDNLTYNLGMNYQGSCGYVAIGMLLSYYDTFLNDDIIPEQYDISSNGNNGNVNQRHNSPGVQRDIIVNPNSLTNTSYGASMSANDYYNYMSSISNQSLHAKLLTIGANKGYYNFNPSENELPAEISMLGIKNVIEQYFQDVLMFQ